MYVYMYSVDILYILLYVVYTYYIYTMHSYIPVYVTGTLPVPVPVDLYPDSFHSDLARERKLSCQPQLIKPSY